MEWLGLEGTCACPTSDSAPSSAEFHLLPTTSISLAEKNPALEAFGGILTEPKLGIKGSRNWRGSCLPSFIVKMCDPFLSPFWLQSEGCHLQFHVFGTPEQCGPPLKSTARPSWNTNEQQHFPSIKPHPNAFCVGNQKEQMRT